jgi:hypothetical protein
VRVRVLLSQLKISLRQADFYFEKTTAG